MMAFLLLSVYLVSSLTINRSASLPSSLVSGRIRESQLISAQVIVGAQDERPLPSHRQQTYLSVFSPPSLPGHAARLRPFRRTDSFQPAFPPELLEGSRSSDICFSISLPMTRDHLPQILVFSLFLLSSDVVDGLAHPELSFFSSEALKFSEG
ncbi:uncharacterized protein BO97DRAFT_161578 [Aspergillus homomorphus CBS 101889]|uniref:Uncharacterized protein n=1 Tax=Aspergillus homomorphus (strain CBS 101889) TaxID=1450537 RepID=A0A395HQQ3_ASPHC|nr:hypothetical protein BO97DRAFT_161578 [Aspergillus homomorphus CBS 101889]RAL09625.1 hypothetical protein BO97DRAFT_161578 [Aspergillus homomorphus CBS 101889]